MSEAAATDRRDDVVSAEAHLKAGDPLRAYDICAAALAVRPDDVRLRQLQCLALARSGATFEAQRNLERLRVEGVRDSETLGMLARVEKDLWQQARSRDARECHLARARQLYADVFSASGSYWAGINAATLAAACGDGEAAKTLARRAREACRRARAASANEELHWLFATLGEAALLLGDEREAREWYARARAQAGFGDIASMRRNAAIVLEARNIQAAWLDEVLSGPVIAVFTGHMIDPPGAACRFPESLAPTVGEAIRRELDASGVHVGYASAASGADIVFHETMLATGRETHVLLPEPPERFKSTSVAAAGESWMRRFDEVLRRAHSVEYQPSSISGEIAYVYNNWMLLGTARLRARHLGGRVRALALWDGTQGLVGGSAAAVADWRGFGEPVACLAPSDARESGTWRLESPLQGSLPTAHGLGSQRIVSLLFADTVGFSRLPDEATPAFVTQFLGTVAAVLDRQPEPPLTRNTWGDGLYFVFGSLAAAGRFALDLCDAVRTTRWADRGLPEDLSLRIALHAGPAHEVLDPVIRQRSFTGAHVSRAARIEPVTPPGSVYASQPFAALCECEGVRDFVCEYVGRMPLAKKYGEYPTYCVRRQG